jgi:hypothetical protein
MATLAPSAARRAVGERDLLEVESDAIDRFVRQKRKVNRVLLLTFTTEQAAGQVQTVGSIEGKARARRFLTTPRENESMARFDGATRPHG